MFERNAEELSGRGAGISTHPQLHAVTKRLGIPFDDSMGIRVNSVMFLDQTAAPTTGATRFALMSSWGRVFRSLRDCIPDDTYHLGKSLVRDRAGCQAASPRSSPTARASAATS